MTCRWCAHRQGEDGEWCMTQMCGVACEMGAECWRILLGVVQRQSSLQDGQCAVLRMSVDSA